MKFRSERDSLVEALATAGRAVSNRMTMPVLAGLLITSTENQLTVTGTDGDLSVQVTLEVIGIDDGTAVIPARLATDITRSLEPGAVTFHAAPDKEEVEISAARSQFTLRSYPVVEFPAVSLTSESSAHIPSGTLAEALRQVVRASSNDDARPLLTGVLLTASNGGLRLVATDSYRLALRDLEGADGVVGDEDILVPAKALTELQRLVNPGDEGTVGVTTTGSEITFHVGNVSISTRLISGSYPDYRQLIPESYPNTLHLGKETLVGALRRVRLLVKDNTTPVRLSMRAGGVDLKVVSQEVGEGTETVDGDYTGEDLTIAFNPSYLIEGIEAVAGDEVIIETSDATRPATVRSGEADSYRYLLMPVRVS
ncbi:MAG: DNA polymerase III subunit beta [Actinomycetes bacterium]